jgi:hypothetical protein
VPSIEEKAARVAASEWSRREACDIDGQTDRSKWAGAHESMRATSEFQLFELAKALDNISAAKAATN